jgi:hypothetical protein
MFDRITLDRPGGPVKPLDLGVLAECLVFYKTVRVIVDQVTFQFLVKSCGPEELLDLLDMGSLQLEFMEGLTGVMSRPVGTRTIYDYGNIASNSLRYLVVARKLFDELAGPSGKGANRMFDRFARLVKRSNYTNRMAADARADWTDHEYTTQAAKAFLSLNAPHYVQPNPLIFQTDGTQDGVVLTSNIDFDAADADYRETSNVADKTITPAYILSAISDTRRDLIVASEFGSEFALGPAPSAIAACRFVGLLKRANQGRDRIEVFQEDVLEGLPSIRDAVNFGGKKYSDVVRLVEKAAQFKGWVQDQKEDEDLRKGYIRDLTHIDWANKLPAKALRWLIFTSTGIALSALTDPIIGTIGVVGLGAADTFLLDKIVKGWTPNQFIDGPLKGFLGH